MKGFQVPGLFNMAKGDVIGYQVAGLGNTSYTTYCLQISRLFNKAKNLKGVQVGVTNISDSVINGAGMGLLNFYKKEGCQEFEVLFADYQNISINFKSGAKRLYAIINAGCNFITEALFFTGGGIRTITKLTNTWYIKPELVLYGYVNSNFRFRESFSLLPLKFGVMYKMNHIGLLEMPSLYSGSISKNNDVRLAKNSFIKPIADYKKSRIGFGISLRLSFIK